MRTTPLISLVVVDEAHCLSEWSHNFWPSYLRLKASLRRATLNVQCILAMTATATTKTLQGVMSSLYILPTNLVQKSQIRENLQLSVTLSGDRMKDLVALMKSSPFVEIRSVIVYCKFQYETDLLSKCLCDNNKSSSTSSSVQLYIDGCLPCHRHILPLLRATTVASQQRTGTGHKNFFVPTR